jgi:hypothetical protein
MTMKKIVMGSAVAGIVVPILIVVIHSIEVLIDPESVPKSLLYGRYLWPSSLGLMAARPSDGFDLGNVTIWTLVILANILLYSIIGLLLGSLWMLTKKAAKG